MLSRQNCAAVRAFFTGCQARRRASGGHCGNLHNMPVAGQGTLLPRNQPSIAVRAIGALRMAVGNASRIRTRIGNGIGMVGRRQQLGFLNHLTADRAGKLGSVTRGRAGWVGTPFFFNVWGSFSVSSWGTRISPHTLQRSPSVSPVAWQVASTAGIISGVWSVIGMDSVYSSPQSQTYRSTPGAVQLAFCSVWTV